MHAVCYFFIKHKILCILILLTWFFFFVCVCVSFSISFLLCHPSEVGLIATNVKTEKLIERLSKIIISVAHFYVDGVVVRSFECSIGPIRPVYS